MWSMSCETINIVVFLQILTNFAILRNIGRNINVKIKFNEIINISVPWCVGCNHREPSVCKLRL